MHTLTLFKPNQTILATFNQHQEITYIFFCFFLLFERFVFADDIFSPLYQPVGKKISKQVNTVLTALALR